jgi:hypothetical protein
VPNPYEALARQKKVAAPIAELDRIGGGPVHYEEVSKLTAEEWKSIAKLAKVNPPSEDTIAEIPTVSRGRH